MSDLQRLIELRILAQHQLIAERLRADPERVIQHARDNLARWGRSYADSDRPRWMLEWELLLNGALSNLLDVLTAETEDAKRLRSSSPFAGIVTPRERWRILKDVDDAAA